MAEPNHTVERRHPHQALSTGLCVGALLTIVMLGSLVAADRIPWLERYALERNGVAYGLFLTIMLYPICRFLHRPLQMFAAGITAWVIFAAAYNLAGLYFRNLFSVLRSPLEVLVDGAVVYGICAVGAWVGGMAFRARHQAIAPHRRRAHDAVPHEH